MALDKLVDSTKLDAALTYTADRIRLKTGGSADLDFDYEGGTGFGDDVDAIPSGGGEPTYGLLTTINITEEVATISYDLPELALSDKRVWVEFDNVTYTKDWMYMAVLDSRQPQDATGFADPGSASPATMNGFGICVFDTPKTIGGNTVSSYSGSVYPQRSSTRVYWNPSPSFTAFTTLRFKLYSAGSRFQSGTIKVYGRVS